MSFHTSEPATQPGSLGAIGGAITGTKDASTGAVTVTGSITVQVLDTDGVRTHEIQVADVADLSLLARQKLADAVSQIHADAGAEIFPVL